MSDEAVRKGRKADQLMQDEVFSGILEKMRNDQYWVFESSKPEESAKRELAWSMLKAIENFRIEVTKMVDNGKVAQRAIERATKNIV
jgi:predicted FMN-binding regulatory protein PaiB